MTRSGLPIRFQDERGGWWTVTGRRAGELMELEFVSDSGERRVTRVVPIDDDAWIAVNEHAWQSLLAQAERRRE